MRNATGLFLCCTLSDMILGLGVFQLVALVIAAGVVYAVVRTPRKRKIRPVKVKLGIRK